MINEGAEGPPKTSVRFERYANERYNCSRVRLYRSFPQLGGGGGGIISYDNYNCHMMYCACLRSYCASPMMYCVLS